MFTSSPLTCFSECDSAESMDADLSADRLGSSRSESATWPRYSCPDLDPGSERDTSSSEGEAGEDGAGWSRKRVRDTEASPMKSSLNAQS